jgi:16S rRNA (guanine(966)-N(2))-methyltransferase RsmD
VKESLFNILGRMVEGRRVLDIFAGTGSLGLEALSRGAESAVLVDKATAALMLENARHTHLDSKAEVMGADVYGALGRLAARGDSFSLIFCDPPYHKGLWERALSMIDESGLLAYEGILVVEHGADENAYPVLRNLQLALNKRYGHTTQLSFFQRRDYLQACEEA